VQAAAAYGLMFRCDPMSFLDRPAEDLPALLAVLEVADRRLNKAQEEAERNGRRR